MYNDFDYEALVPSKPAKRYIIIQIHTCFYYKFLQLINAFYWHIWIIFKWKGTIIFGHNLEDLTIMLSASAGPLGRIRYLIPDLPKLPIIHQSVCSKDL